MGTGKVYVRSAGNDFYDNGPCGGAPDRESQILSCTGVEIDDTKNFEEVITVAALNADGIKRVRILLLDLQSGYQALAVSMGLMKMSLMLLHT